jgi:hypothetical protein
MDYDLLFREQHYFNMQMEQKMIIPLPGVMSPEDVAMTGVGVHLERHGKPSFPWLYAYEKPRRINRSKDSHFCNFGNNC